MLAGIQSEIKQLQAEEAAPAGAASRRGRGAARRAAARRLDGAHGSGGARAGSFTASIDHERRVDALIPAAPPSQYGGVVGIAMQ